MFYIYEGYSIQNHNLPLFKSAPNGAVIFMGRGESFVIEIQGAVLAAFSFVGGTGILSGLFLRQFDKLGKKMDCQEEARIEESVVTIQMLQAIGHLSEATAIAQQRGHTNGEMDTALKYYTASKDKLNSFMTRRCAERTHGRG